MTLSLPISCRTFLETLRRQRPKASEAPKSVPGEASIAGFYLDKWCNPQWEYHVNKLVNILQI